MECLCIGRKSLLGYNAHVILPMEKMPAPVIPEDFPEQVASFFEPGGGLENAHKDQAFPYEVRQPQMAMAADVARAILEKKHLAVEAGTGVGKSFAYLVPMILAVTAAKKRGVIATHTISLQEQLIRKDIPFLQHHLGVDFTAVLVKGKSNYLCLRRLSRARKMGGDMFRTDELSWVDRLREWIKTAQEGSVQEMPEAPPSHVWEAVCVEDGNCLGRKCPEYAQCYFHRARDRARRADILVANHHLLFSDLAFRQNGKSLLPDYEVLVLDEAHAMEDVASEHFGLRLSRSMFEHWMRRVYQPEKNRGFFHLLRDSEGIHLMDEWFLAMDALFAALEQWAARDGRHQEIRVPSGALHLDTRFFAVMGRVCTRLKTLAEEVEDADLKAELRQAVRRGLALRDETRAFVDQAMDDHVYWLAVEGRRRQMVMYSAPVEVAPVLKEQVFLKLPCVIMTSATLAVNGSLNFYLQRIGADDLARTSQHGSPFDFARQMRIQVPQHMPEPGSSGYDDAVADALAMLAIRSRGGTMALFTSVTSMKNVAAACRDRLAEAGLRLLVQGEGSSRHALLEEFRLNEGTVLLGLNSFWVGVDVRGDALRMLVITKLPFAVPDHPLESARQERIVSRGGNAFRDLSLPQAVIQFRQGVGRLIRTASDTGVVAVLDRRVVDKWYGHWFLRSIPDCPVELEDMQ